MDEILVVDDEPANLKLVQQLLGEAGYRARLANNGELALRSAKIKPPALVLLDIRMPGMDGYEVCKQLKKDETTRSIPVIFLSALEEEEDKVKAFEAGGVDYVGKPIRKSEVMARIGTHLALRRAQLELERRNAELEAANKELEAFSYSVSHDLRAPLRAICGFASALEEDCAGALDAEGQRYLGLIRQNAGRMGRLIDDLLALARSSRSELRAADVDMTALAQEAFAELRAGAPERQIRFALGALPPAHCDRSLVRQVLTNLFSNAIKYTSRKPEAVIEISGPSGLSVNTYTVTDNGAGFDNKYSSKLFGVFQRLHSGEEFEGNGIELAIVKRIVERHGGRVWAEGEVGKGAAFHFTLPPAKEAGISAASGEQSATAAAV